MNQKIALVLIVLLAGTLACVVPAGIPPTPVVITQVVVIPNTEAPVQPSPSIPLPSPSPAIALPTITQQSITTSTSTATATVTATATLSGPIATFIKNANCRAGPGTGYDVVTSYFSGQTVEIVGRNPDFNNTWWQIKMPTGGKCWVSFSTAQASGDFDAIPTVKP